MTVPMMHAPLTFEMEQDIGLVILEHLRHKLGVHVLDVDFLEILVQHHNGFVQLLLWRVSACTSRCCLHWAATHNIDNNARK